MLECKSTGRPISRQHHRSLRHRRDGIAVLLATKGTVDILKRDVDAIQTEIKKMGDILTKRAAARTLDNTA